MSDLNKKMQVLVKIASILNNNHVTWAVGGSLLLYFKGITDTFKDIDLMVDEKDIERFKTLIFPIGEVIPCHFDQNFKTRTFLELMIDDVDVDVMAGLVIVKDGMDYDCSLLAEQIVEYIEFDGEQIPLQSLSDWKRYYTLMGRTSKVELIEKRRKR